MIALLLVLLILFSLGVRIYYISNNSEEIFVNGELLNKAQIGEKMISTAKLFENGFSMEGGYICLLSFFCMFFGNFAVSGVYLNILLQTVTIMLLFLAIKKVSNGYIGFGIGVIIAAIPVYLQYIKEISVFNLEGLLCAAGLLLLATLVKPLWKSICSRRFEKTDVEESADMEEITQEEQSVNQTKFIENPLPVPKRKEHKRMDYALETAENDDYDITDMTGKDFFDID